MSNEREILKQVGIEAKKRRGELISLYKKQGKGNVLINLSHGFIYKYGDTIPEPQIVIPGIRGHQERDWDFWEKLENL